MAVGALLYAGDALAELARVAARPHRLTPGGWRIAPAGSEFGAPAREAGFVGPLNAALSPNGRYLLVASSGLTRYDTVDLFDLRAHRRAAHILYDSQRRGVRSVFYGVAFSADGKRAWAAGGGQNVIHSYTVRGGRLTPGRDIPNRYFPAGLAYARTPRGPRLYVADNAGGRPSLTANPPGYQVSAIDLTARGKHPLRQRRVSLGAALQPLGVAFGRSARKAYVTNWMGRSVSVIDTATERATGAIALSPANDPLRADHPSAIAANPGRDEVYTANANSDTVSVIDTDTDRVAATIDVSLRAGEAPGAAPDGLAVSPDGRTLFVAEGGEDAVAVVDVASRSVRGFIPTSWYPTAVAVTPDGRRLVVVNSNDSGVGPRHVAYYSPVKGSISIVSLANLGRRLAGLTAQVMRNNHALGTPAGVPAFLRGQIRHVIYVVTENRTYDSYLGSLRRGNGDPRFNVFDDRSAPNHRQLARRFTLLDNFYSDAEVSADGHNWATQAAASDYVEKMFPVVQTRTGQRGKDLEDVPLRFQFPSEPLQSDPSVPRPAAAETRGYLWDDAYDHAVGFRDYGEFDSLNPAGACLHSGNHSNITRLQSRFGTNVDPLYPSYSLLCADHLAREPEWRREFDAFERSGTLPALEIVRLPNDHTAGPTAGRPTPESYVADNDLALGQMVQALTHSPDWADTAMFVVEDDAQNGPDHVDAHRTLALVISPFTQHGAIDHSHYDTASMLATLEDLLALPPMSIFDQRATRMWRAFSAPPNLAPYDFLAPRIVPFGERGAPTNRGAAPLARAARAWNFQDADAAPEGPLNQAIWKSVKGPLSHMPAPRHALIAGSLGDQ